ncbi:MAG: hypothetical protein E7330_04055 [Clostridiales bacterium]|nr:hypothetical protein [Clostridiales bacterium]
MTEWFIGTAEFAPIGAIRAAAGERAEAEAIDEYAVHLYVKTDAGEPIGAGRIYPVAPRNAVRFDKLLTTPKYRGTVYDELLLRIMLFKAQEMPFQNIETVAGSATAGLIEKFGLKQAEDPSPEEGKTFYTIPRDAVIWWSACGEHHGTAGKKE